MKKDFCSKKLFISIAILLVPVCNFLFSQTLLRDTRFNSNLLTTNSETRCIEVLNDESNKGKVLIGGFFNYYNGQIRDKIARLNPDGTVDLTFNGPDFDGDGINTIAVQPWDNKILVGGSFTLRVNASVTYTNIARLNEDGSIDATFNPTGGGTDRRVWKILVLSPEKRIVVGGVFDFYKNVQLVPSQWTDEGGAVMINENGSLYKNLKINDGEWSGGGVYCMDLDYDGRILVGGEFGEIDGVIVRRAARLNRDGTFDNSFINSGYLGVGPSSSVFSIKAQPDNRILIGGAFSAYVDMTIGKYVNNPRNRVARLNADGTLDKTFNYTTTFSSRGFNSAEVWDFLIDSSGKILVAGGFTEYDGVSINRLIRLLPNGDVDTDFNIGTGFNNIVYDLAYQDWFNGKKEPEGQLLAAGSFTSFDSYSGQQYAVRLVNKEAKPLAGFIKNFICKTVSPKKILLSWVAAQQSVIYNVERSTDGRNFKKIASYTSQLAGTNLSHYDDFTHSGMVYYRISVQLQTSLNALTSAPIEYSNVHSVLSTSTFSSSVIALDNGLKLLITSNSVLNESFNIQVISMAGQQLLAKRFTMNGKVLDQMIPVSQSMKNSLIVVRNDKGEVVNKVLVR